MEREKEWDWELRIWTGTCEWPVKCSCGKFCGFASSSFMCIWQRAKLTSQWVYYIFSYVPRRQHLSTILSPSLSHSQEAPKTFGPQLPNLKSSSSSSPATPSSFNAPWRLLWSRFSIMFPLFPSLPLLSICTAALCLFVHCGNIFIMMPTGPKVLRSVQSVVLLYVDNLYARNDKCFNARKLVNECTRAHWATQLRFAFAHL